MKSRNLDGNENRKCTKARHSGDLSLISYRLMNTFTQGRFYDPTRPFGPPHASSTGVYLEGLIDAHQMAKAVGDSGRQEKYRRSIIRGLRSVMQLTFLDDVDLYYVHQKDKVLGGVRETVYDNEIRVDNIQHNLMGILKILRDFESDDYRP